MRKRFRFDILAELRKYRMDEAPQFIQPLDNGLIERAKSWILKLHKGLDKNGIKYQTFDVYGTTVYNLLKVKISSYQGRNNIFYTVKNNQVNFFSFYEVVQNLKGINSAVTQFLVYRDSDNNENGISSITLNRVAWNLVFPISKSFLCDKQQTKYGKKAWEFIVEQSFSKGLSVSIYDTEKKEIADKFSDFTDYLKRIGQYYGSEKDYQRYQVLTKE